VSIVALLISGWMFSAPMFIEGRAVLDGLADTLPLLFLFFVPAVTMRLYAEETKSGTAELLSTLPVRDEDVLAAKYLSAMAVVTLVLAGTTVYWAVLRFFGRPDPGAAFGLYVGLWLTAAVLAAAGTWASTLTRSQVTAFILAFLAGFAFFMVGKVHLFLPPALGSLADFLGFDSHLESISRGVIDSRDILYYLSLAGWFLWLTWLRQRARRLEG
ncbi:MAG: ABC-2 transporter permease, partial [Elusimicrobia bacterium]|nr:ABC-2 transporter permease [Elusimicrobiota bacterium]